MGLLDALFQNDTGGGLLGGLPSSWQWQNPADKNTDQDFLAALRQDPSMGNNLVAPQSPFGAVPSFAQQPQSVFASGTGSIAPSPGMMPPQAPQMAPQPPMQAPPQAAPAPVPPAPQSNPINSMNIGGGYQMPQFGSAQDYTPQAPVQTAQQPTDVSAQSRQAQPEQALPPAFGGGSSVLGRLGNPDGLIARLTGNDTRSVTQQNLKAQFEAVQQTLRDGGMSPREAQSKAMLAVMNPEAGKTILNEALTNKEKYQKTGVDALGNETYGFVNERDQTINGKALGAEGSSQSAGGFLAPGVKSVDSTLTGGDYLKQFSPEVQAAVQNYVDGKSMPTGNPRKGFTQTVKMIAQKYGADTGQSVDDVTYAERRTMRNQLALSSNSSMGGILSNGESSFKHLAEYAKSAADQGNVSHNFPLGGALAHAQNYATNAGGGSDTQAKVKAINDNLGKYGAESTKFYAGTGGGVEERLNALKEMNGNTTSGEEAAAYAEKEKSLMLDRLHTKLQEIRNTLGEAEGNRIIAKHMPDIQKNIEAIDANIARLKAPTVAAAAPSGIPSGWSVKVH